MTASRTLPQPPHRSLPLTRTHCCAPQPEQFQPLAAPPRGPSGAAQRSQHRLRRGQHRVVRGVLPFLDPDTVVLVRQYRYVAGRHTWEMPTGGVAPGEPIEDAAQRELAEESGYRAGRSEPVCSYHTSKSVMDETAHGAGPAADARSGPGRYQRRSRIVQHLVRSVGAHRVPRSRPSQSPGRITFMVASYLDALAPVLSQVVEPAAVQVDQQGAFPRASVDALGRAGMLG